MKRPGALQLAFAACLSTSTFAAEFTVANTNSMGAGSFSQAIADANAMPGPDTIVFLPAAFAAPETIQINGGYTITDDLTIQGPGRGLLTLLALNVAGDAFLVQNPGTPELENFTLEDLTLQQFGTANRRLIRASQEGTLTLRNVDLVGSGVELAAASGMAVAASRSSLTMQNCTVRGFSSFYRGGAVLVFTDVPNKRLEISDSAFTGNSVVGTANANFTVNGGALAIEGRLAGLPVISGSEFSGNFTVNGSGGAIALSNTNLRIINSTISGNDAELIGGGVAIYGATAFNELVEVYSSTITDNVADADSGALGLSNDATYEIANSIVARNRSAGDDGITIPVGATVRAGFSLFDDSADFSQESTPGSNIVDRDPMIGPLADNGGPTRTHAVLANSPVINAGDTADSSLNNVSFDQRGAGFPRIADGGLEMGAVEFDTPPAPAATSGSSAIGHWLALALTSLAAFRRRNRANASSR